MGYGIPGYGIRDTGIWDTGSRDTGYGITGYGIRDNGIWDTGRGATSMGYSPNILPLARASAARATETAAAARTAAARAPAVHWSRYELHNRTSIHSEKLIITISPKELITCTISSLLAPVAS